MANIHVNECGIQAMGSEQLQVPSLVFDLQRTTLVLFLLMVAIDAEFTLSIEFVGNSFIWGFLTLRQSNVYLHHFLI